MKINLSKKISLLLSVTVFVALLTVSVLLVSCRDGGEGDKEDERAIVTSGSYTYKTDISAIAEALDTKEEKYLVLANKTIAVGADFLPEDIEPVDTKYTLYGKEISLAGNARIAAVAMIEEMWAEGIRNVYITSGYRSYSYQESLFNTYLAKEKAAHPSWSDQEVREAVLKYSAAPGTSEHQTGLCIDLFVSPGMKELENYGSEGQYDDIGFAETEAFVWLKQNAHKFGFILRYPEDKVATTGYAYESWHYRFVGIDAASQIFEEKITLEEYLAK